MQVVSGATIPYPDPPLEGRGFVLRPFAEEDMEPARALEQDPAAARWVPPLPADDADGVLAFYERCRRDGQLLHLVIADPTSGAYVGETMLAPSDHRVGEVGCCVVPAARGRGIATGALRALTDWAFAELGLGRVQVFVGVENVAAYRLAEAAGFRREGTLRGYWEENGRRLDAVILARLPGDQA
jgi:RimJ/RimL family protein N-acetyltransferase